MEGENYKYGRKMWSTMTFVTVATSATPLVGADTRRVGVRTDAGITNRVTVSDKPTVTDGVGWKIHAAQSRGLELCRAIQGMITTRPLFAIAAVASEVICVIETFADEENG